MFHIRKIISKKWGFRIFSTSCSSSQKT